MDAAACFLFLALLFSPISADSFNCKCNYSTVWIDLIVLMDASEAATQEGLAEMWASVRTMLAWFNVQNSNYSESKYFTQVGVIAYASRASVIASLGALSGDEIQAIDSLPFFEGDKGTNIDYAVKTAELQFDSPIHRPSSKKVILLMATAFDFRHYGSQDVENFEKDGGIFIVYDDIEKHGDLSLPLTSLASPGYYFNNLNNSLIDVQSAFCDANCFCPNNEVLYLASQPRGAPIGGCFRVVNTPANHNFSSDYCHEIGKIVSFDESPQMTDFLLTSWRFLIFFRITLGFINLAEFYIGLAFNFENNRYEWQDGSPLDQSYQPWSIGFTPTPDPTASCVAVTTSKLWVKTNCKNGYIYSCQGPPCDSTNYC